MINAQDIKIGTCIRMDNKLYFCIDFLHVKPGKGNTFMRVKLKDVVNGYVLERRFNIGEKQNMRQISGLRPPEILRRCHNHLHNGPRPHRMDDIIQFFQTLCKGFPCFARLKDCLLS